MEVSFELTEADLHEAQRQRAARLRKLLRTRPAVALITLLVAPLLWPLARAWGLHFYAYLAAVVIAGGVVLIWGPKLPKPRLRGLEHWAARRATARAVAGSVLGRVTLVVTDHGVKRLREGAPALEVTARDVAFITASPSALVLHLASRRVLVIPRRALESEAQAAELEQRVERVFGRQAQRLTPDD
ncbi:MAG: hypothetical protein IPJ65_35575 [Archangiaceae bacterium]|nr:hypothetical protein [Archangiaceae bacterium]